GDDSEDRETRFYNKQMLVDVPSGSNGPAYRLDDEEYPFGFEFVRKAIFREINFGEYGQGAEKPIAGETLARAGFSLCRHCGYVQGKQNGKQPHAYTCPARQDDPEDDRHFIDCLYLYREFSSEALRILLPIVVLEGFERPLNSFIAALQLGLKLKFGGKVDHLKVTTYSEPAEDGEGRRRYLMLYDSVPGGTGYLQDLMQSPDSLMEVFRKAHDTMTACACNRETDKDGCYRCLFAYRNSYGMESTSRTTAVELLGRLLDGESSPVAIDTVDDIIINPAFESELEAFFISALHGAKKEGTKIVQQVIQGKPAYHLTVQNRYYTVEPQVTLDDKDNVVISSRPDFLIRKIDSRSTGQFKPIAVFLDGFRFHRSSVESDSAKRLAIIRSGRYHVWSLTWNDVSTYMSGDNNRAGSPFSEGLNPDMKPVQDKLLEKMGIRTLFKTALENPMEMLLSYLADPDDQAWRNLAFTRILGWFDNRKMRDDAFIGKAIKRVQQRTPTPFHHQLDCLDEAAWGEYVDGGGSDLYIDCAVPLESIRKMNAQSAMSSIWLDDEESESDGFRESWQAFLSVGNLLQFLPLFGFFTSRGIKSGIYEKLPFSQGEAFPAEIEVGHELILMTVF
ncbi:MAG TPA: DUF1998 domain-containing protein, partial [Desulfobacterales bacterium]|nr:DUF1998 domain-containing protein [Desulfobacterales bacterium]